MSLKPMFDMFSFWSVGNGYNIDVWNQAWIEEGYCVAASRCNSARLGE